MGRNYLLHCAQARLVVAYPEMRKRAVQSFFEFDAYMRGCIIVEASTHMLAKTRAKMLGPVVSVKITVIDGVPEGRDVGPSILVVLRMMYGLFISGDGRKHVPYSGKWHAWSTGHHETRSSLLSARASLDGVDHR